jgi:hypothetical protein
LIKEDYGDDVLGAVLARESGRNMDKKRGGGEKKIQCNYCKKFGHKADRCFAKQKDEAPGAHAAKSTSSAGNAKEGGK